MRSTINAGTFHMITVGSVLGSCFKSVTSALTNHNSKLLLYKHEAIPVVSTSSNSILHFLNRAFWSLTAETMSSAYFKVFEHTIPCQHLREYPRSTKTRQEDVLQLAIKQYQPLHNDGSLGNAVTIIATHANGFTKVEEYFFSIFHQNRKHGYFLPVIIYTTEKLILSSRLL